MAINKLNEDFRFFFASAIQPFVEVDSLQYDAVMGEVMGGGGVYTPKSNHYHILGFTVKQQGAAPYHHRTFRLLKAELVALYET